MFSLLQSPESRVAVPLAFLLVVGLFIAQFFPDVANVATPFVALMLGMAVGWVLGEAFTYASGVIKFIVGILTSLFASSVTLAEFRQQVGETREKAFYLLSIIPITDPSIINAIVWFSLSFIVFFVLSIGVNFTRRMEKTQKNP